MRANVAMSECRAPLIVSLGAGPQACCGRVDHQAIRLPIWPRVSICAQRLRVGPREI
jgi:hypothetical protein